MEGTALEAAVDLSVTDVTGLATSPASVLREMEGTETVEVVVAIMEEAMEAEAVAANATSATGSVILPVSVARKRTGATNVTGLDTSPGTAARRRTLATTATRLVTS